jgi:hypothetical protein
MLARSSFTRVEASGFQAMRFHLTAQATANGFALRRAGHLHRNCWVWSGRED